MAQSEESWGIDLRLLRDLERQRDRDRGRDLSTIPRPEHGIGVDLEKTAVDLETLSGVDNLKQALLLRFLTPAGELASLGHPDYGTRLFELIGELNTQTNRNRAKMYVLQALAAEARVKEVRSVQVTQNRAEPTRMDIDVWLVAIDGDTLLNLVFPFFLEGGVSA